MIREEEAIADFIDWLVERGYVIARRDDVHLWTPISPREGESLAWEWFLYKRDRAA